MSCSRYGKRDGPGARPSFAARSVLLAIVVALAGCAGSSLTPRGRSPSREVDPADEPRGGWTPCQLGLVDSIQIFPRDHDVYGLRFSLLSGACRSMYGLDAAGLMTSSDACAGAIQFAAMTNYVARSGFGIQVGALVGNRTGRVQGSQMHEQDAMTGVQLGGLVNYGNTNGLQVAGIVNGLHAFTDWQARKAPSGTWQKGVLMTAARALALLSLGVHHHRSPGYVNGFQVAGLANEATHVNGVQIAAGWNGTRTGTGLQVGLVNTSRDSCGLQLGLVNVSRNFSGLQLGLVNVNDQGWVTFFPFLNPRF